MIRHDLPRSMVTNYDAFDLQDPNWIPKVERTKERCSRDLVSSLTILDTVT